MVYRLTSLANVNLWNGADAYGTQADTIIVLGHNSQSIKTYSNNDIVDASTAGSGVSFLNVALGAGDDHFLGSSGDDYVFDGSGNDFVDLAGGDDVVSVDTGNDQYFGGEGTDKVDFRSINDTGMVSSPATHGVSFDLAKTTAQNLGERGVDLFSGFENVLGTAFGDKFYGTNSGNNIQAGEGNDLVYGRDGGDIIDGQGGADVIIGGKGRDVMGGSLEFVAGRDRYCFEAFNESGTTTALADVIVNFDNGSLTTDDRIDFSKLDGNTALAGLQDLLNRGNAASFGTDARGEFRWVSVGADTHIFVDSDSDAAHEMMIIVQGVTGLTAADFLL